MRTESDFIGKLEIDSNALYGINSVRAKNNFPNSSKFNLEWYKAVGLVKKACYLTYSDFKAAVNSKHNNLPINFIDDKILESLIESSSEISEGKYFENFIVPAIQGGAGTSINLNINEIIANLSLKKVGKNYGEYNAIHPIEHANIYQSTNDVIPTALKLAIIKLLQKLEEEINNSRLLLEQLENKYRNTLRTGYTQMNAAVPSSYGLLFSSYNEALSRDWWRVSKCFERIKTVNLGGSAIGTGITVPQYFIMNVVSNLQKLTNLPITRSDNLSDTTSNLDSFVEVHAILKSHAVNLEKIVSDMRLLSSDIATSKEFSIPQKQVGSSIMPNKVNPVIPEFIISIAHKIYANDSLVSSLSAQGVLELNPYLPIIGDSILNSLELLISANKTLKDNLFAGIEINKDLSDNDIYKSSVITTALIPLIGYNKANILAIEMKENNVDIFVANNNLQIIDKNKINNLLSTQNLLKLGFNIKDIL